MDRARQALLFRAVDIGADLFAMTATLSRAQAMRASRDPHAKDAVELADIFARMMRRRIQDHFRALRSNEGFSAASFSGPYLYITIPPQAVG